MISSVPHTNRGIDRFVDPPYAVARIHQGRFDCLSQPHTFKLNQDEISLFFDGKILSVKGVRDESLGEARDVEILEGLMHDYSLEESLCKMNGTFAGVILNHTKQEAILFDDKHGTRYLLYGLDGNRLVFSSDLNAWRSLEGFEKQIDWQGVLEFFRFGQVLGENTFVCGVTKMRNGSVLKYRLTGELDVVHYWDYSYKEGNNERDSDYFVNEFSRRIKQAMKRCFIRTSGVLGIDLSGGLDTRLLLSAIDDSYRDRVMCCTFGEKGCLESGIARQLARAKCVKHVFVTYDYDRMGALMSDAILTSEPGTDATLSLIDYYVSSVMANKCGLSLEVTGTEGDVLFGGRIQSTALGPLKVTKRSVVDLYRGWAARTVDFTDEELLELFSPVAHLIKGKLNCVGDGLNARSTGAHAKHPGNIVDYLFLTPNPRNIRGPIIARHWVEEIPLMFDDDLVELYLEMPPALRCSDFRIAVLRKTDHALARVPWIDTMLPLYVPHFMMYLARRGLNRITDGLIFDLRLFSKGRIDLRKHLKIKHTDHDALLRVHLRSCVTKIVLDKDACSGCFLDRSYVDKFLTDFLNFKQVSWLKMGTLLSFEYWLRTFAPALDKSGAIHGHLSSELSG